MGSMEREMEEALRQYREEQEAEKKKQREKQIALCVEMSYAFRDKAIEANEWLTTKMAFKCLMYMLENRPIKIVSMMFIFFVTWCSVEAKAGFIPWLVLVIMIIAARSFIEHFLFDFDLGSYIHDRETMLFESFYKPFDQIILAYKPQLEEASYCFLDHFDTVWCKWDSHKMQVRYRTGMEADRTSGHFIEVINRMTAELTLFASYDGKKPDK